jgi:AAA15 family ATPase/GTPase
MIQIDKIEISYFRSIYNLKLDGLQDLSVLSGKNDCGKSNILKALNLFFNNETDWKNPLDFQQDFSYKRLNEVRKETIKGRQFIRVKVSFIRGIKKSIKSLPEKFTVTKTWYRNSSTPDLKTSLDLQFKQGKIKSESLHRAEAQLQNYLNRIRYEYIPAVKDRNFFLYSLALLQDTIMENRSSGSVEKAVKNLNNTVEQGTEALNREFESVCGVKTNIRLPSDLSSLFKAFSVATMGIDDDIALTKRGDGIQTRFIPSLLFHVSENSKLTYLWGFEEPENCLEHALASELANNLYDTYCENNQIILTTHSPAFLSLEGEGVSKYRIYNLSDETESAHIYPHVNNHHTLSLIQEELGLLELARKQQLEYLQKKEELESMISSVSELEKKYLDSNKPILLTEGRTDPKILSCAWASLYPGVDMPFKVLSCSTLPKESGEAAGASVLKMALESARPDHPITIGLFDYDDRGIKEYKSLNKNFSKKTALGDIKIHKNLRSAGFCIPTIQGKETYREVENLPIEFVFPDEYIIKTTTDGHGLHLEQEKAVTIVKGKKIKECEASGNHNRKIVGNKVQFAEEVVPTFDKDAFVNFKHIFDLVGVVIAELQPCEQE